MMTTETPTETALPIARDEFLQAWLRAKIEVWQAAIAALETRLEDARQQERYFQTWLEDERRAHNGR
jgi:hypothetical protein